MPRRSPARFLAPLALVGVVLALFLVIKASSGGGSGSSAQTSAPTPSRTTAGPARQRPTRTTSAPASYRVMSGDTLQGIAAKTGVSIDAIRRLNPGVNPQALAVGQILKLKG